MSQRNRDDVVVGAKDFSPHSPTPADALPEGFRMTELGPLPAEWRVVRLGEVLREINIQAGKANEDARNLPVLSLTKRYGLVLQTERFGKRIATEDVSNYKVVSRGQIVLNPYVIWEGAVHILSKYKAGLVSPAYPVLETLSDRADPWFVDHLLRMPSAIASYNRFASGAVNRRRAIRIEDFLRVKIPLPPLPEQRAIAHVLRTVQEAQEATERVITALKELKKSLMRHLFSYGPVPPDRTDQVELQETELGPLPAHWQVVRLGEVFEIQQGKSLSPKSRSGSRMRPFLRTANVLWGRIDTTTVDFMHFEESEEQRLALKSGDLLVCEGGDIGRTAMWNGQIEPCYYQNHLHRLRPIRPDVEPAFYMYWMETAWTILVLYGGTGNKTTIPNLSQSRLSSFSIPLPPLPEQQEIARILQAVDAKIAAEEQRKEVLEGLFKSLLAELMSGRVRLPPAFVSRFVEEKS